MPERGNMGYCINCKNNYDNTDFCPDCNDILYYEIFSNENEAIALKIFNYVKEAGADSIEYIFDEEDNKYYLFSSYEEEILSKELALMAIDNVLDNDEKLSLKDYVDDAKEDIDKELNESLFTDNKTFVSEKDRYDNYLSSATSLLSVGIIGMIGVIAEMTGLINLNLSGSFNTIFHVIMLLLFGSFIFMGINSLRDALKSKKAISTENLEKEELSSYLKKNIDLFSKDNEFEEDTTEEEKYLIRFEYLKNELKEKYPTKDDVFIEMIIENNYNYLYTEN